MPETDSINIAPSGLMDIENAAIYLGVSVWSVRWLRRMGKVPFLKIGAKLLVQQADLDAFIQEAKNSENSP